MAKIIIIVLALVLGGFIVSQMSSQPPLRGMIYMPGHSLPQLLARARPAVTFELDPQIRPLASGWCTIRPQSRDNLDGSARLWLALYRHDRGVLATAVADAEEKWQWPAGDHAAFPPIRRMHQQQGNRTLFETITVLDASHDPFCGTAAGGNAPQSLQNTPASVQTGLKAGSPVCLVYRARLLLEHDRCQVIVEYHEDLAQDLVLDIAYATDYLNDFQKRARAAGRIVRLEKEDAHALAENITKMETLDKAISRRSLARWTGAMKRVGEL